MRGEFFPPLKKKKILGSLKESYRIKMYVRYKKEQFCLGLFVCVDEEALKDMERSKEVCGLSLI